MDRTVRTKEQINDLENQIEEPSQKAIGSNKDMKVIK